MVQDFVHAQYGGYPILLFLNGLSSADRDHSGANEGANLATSSYLSSEHVDVARIAAQSPAFRDAGLPIAHN